MMENFLNTYRALNKDNLHRLKEIYAEDVRFIDPAHTINGLAQLRRYFGALYRDIDPPVFRFIHDLRVNEDAYVQWEMDFMHPRLNRGRIITISGSSYLRFNEDNKVCFHRDYFDLGAMLYEQLPVLGKLILFVKRGLGR